MWKKVAMGAALAVAATSAPASAATTVVATGSNGPGSQWSVTDTNGLVNTSPIVGSVSGWAAPVAGSQWIRGQNSPAPAGTYLFTHVFTLSNVGNIQSFVLRWLADNQVLRVTVNGTDIFGPVASNNSVSQLGSQISVSGALGAPLFVNGQNTMIWQVYNRPLSGTNNVGLSSTTTITAVPEPGTWLLMILGLGAVGFAMRRRHSTSVNLQFA